MSEARLEDLSGDPVYDFLKTKKFEGFELAGGRLITANFGSFRAASVVIEIGYRAEGTKAIHKISYNYKKILRGIKKELKYPDQCPIKHYTKEVLNAGREDKPSDTVEQKELDVPHSDD